MEHNKEENTVQETEHSVPVKKSSMRASYSRWSTGKRPMFLMECQVEKRGLATSISLLYEFEPKTLNERFLWNVWKQIENRNKILQEDRNFMKYEMSTVISDCVTNT